MRLINKEFKTTEIGRIPKGWKFMAIGDVADTSSGGTPSRDKKEYFGGNIPWVKSGELKDNVIFGTEEKITEEGLKNSSAKKFVKGTLLIALYGATVGKTAILGIEATTNQAVCAIVPKNNSINPKFLQYYLIFRRKLLISVSSGGAQPNISQEIVQAFKLPFPPLPEQKKIAEILTTADEAIQKVDEAIEKTERLKKGLMHELLTKGIGHREFKDTDIGKIPKEWEVARISEIGDVKGGKRLPKGHQLVDFKTPYPYIRVVDFMNMAVNVNNLKFLLPETQKIIKQYSISANDVYISIAGTVGIAGIIPQELDGANLTENAAKLCNLRNVNKKFLAYILNSFVGQHQIAFNVGKATQSKLALFRIEQIKLPLPPLPEQQKISEILSTVDKKLELLREKKETFERIKKGLMNDLLTGRKRVKLEA